VETLLELSNPWGYVAVAILAMAESGLFIGLVLPGEAAMLLGGFLVYQGRADLALMLACGCCGAVAGDSLSFWIGRVAGPRLQRSRLGRRIGDERWSRAHRYVKERGGRAVFLGRFVGVLRALVPAIAGSSGLPYRQFIPYSVAGAVAWVTAFIVLGSVAGGSWHLIDQWAGRASIVVVGVIALGAAIMFAAKWAARHRREVAERLAKVRRNRRVAGALDRYRRQIEFLKRRVDPSLRIGLYFTLGVALTVAAASAFGALLEEVVEGETQAGLDGPLAHFIVEHRSPEVTGIMRVVTQFGGLILVAGVLGASAVIVYVRNRDANGSAFFVATLIGALGLDDAIKLVVGRPRPHLSPLVHATGSSFPSGHALAATAMCAALAFVLSRRREWRTGVWIWAAALFLSSVVALSRVYLGVHWPTDVIGGMILGAFWVAFTTSGLALGGELRDRRKPRVEAATAHPDAGGTAPTLPNFPVPPPKRRTHHLPRSADPD
jgi:membrane protein DedA with SNARE-associated domain/membrane-associated phospholipid phosphatase